MPILRNVAGQPGVFSAINGVLTRGVTLRRIPPPPATTSDDWIRRFDQALAESGLAPLTIRTYRRDLVLFLKWIEQTKGTPVVLADLSEADLLGYRQYLVNVARLRPATINQRLQAIRWLCRWALRQKVFAANPATDLKSLPMARRRQPAGLTEPEAHALLRVAGASRRGHAQRNYAIVQLLLQAGLRIGEVVTLRVADLVIRERSGCVRVRLGKGGKEREVPLNASARRALRTYLQARPQVQPDHPLFLSDRDRVLSERSLQHLIRSLARQAKITRIPVSPHTLRHTFALNYLRQNPGKLVSLASLLGHESLDTTALYTRPSAEELADDLERSRMNVYG
ncbi:MAG: tyrosine-type recombinase/integrase [Planctomycetaceae bacterium]|nr:tyrosine-type recombinase/integrase [Planctomycetaceae bacterium]MBV8266540.1 tyrosine-type recombinase/integrase [Planctomycetaceae bacterium]